MGPIRVISLGMGVQSVTLAAMAARGDIEPVDHIIHADTTWEHSKTYEYAERFVPWLRGQGQNVVIVSDRGSAGKVVDKYGGVFAPVYTVSESDGSVGMLNRQCTDRWKIKPINDWIKAQHPDWRRRGLQTLLGISLDEFQRMKQAKEKWRENVYPLVDKRMTRNDCLNWLTKNGLEIPAPSACVFCPYKSKRYWQDLKRQGGTDWQTAVSVDNAIRDKRPGYKSYVSQYAIPLSEIVIPEDVGAVQGTMFDEGSDVCDSGYCLG